MTMIIIIIIDICMSFTTDAYYGAGIVKGWTVRGSNPGRGRYSASV
jgi:hypothetical protein